MPIMMRGRLPLTRIATAVALAWGTQAQAVGFNIGEIEGSFDSSLSIGASSAARQPDPEFISNFNSPGVEGRASARTNDDNRLNFKSGETFSKIFKGVHDRELKYGDSGAFVRGRSTSNISGQGSRSFKGPVSYRRPQTPC